MFSCEYCEIFRNTYFEKHLRTVASQFFYLERVNKGDSFHSAILLLQTPFVNWNCKYQLHWIFLSQLIGYFKVQFQFSIFFFRFLSPTAEVGLQKVPGQLIHVDYLSIQKCKFKIICDFNLKLENVARQLYLNLNAIYLKSIQDIFASKRKSVLRIET